MNISYEEVMERVELLTAELAKIKRALVAVNEGVPFTEAFNDELLVEWADVKHAKYQLIEMMHHLLKFRFCTTDYAYRHWFSERISLSRRELQADIEWRPLTCSYDQNIVNEIMREFDELYNNAKAMYVRDAEGRSNLAYGLEHLPEKCPWTLIDLVDKNYSDLLRMIPAIDDPRDRLDDAVKIIDELTVYE